jgi:GST-like protein
MAPYPWVVPWKRQQQNLDDFVIARVVLFRASDQSGSERISVSGEQW